MQNVRLFDCSHLNSVRVWVCEDLAKSLINGMDSSCVPSTLPLRRPVLERSGRRSSTFSHRGSQCPQHDTPLAQSTNQPTSTNYSIRRTVYDRSVVWILKYRLTRCTFHRQPPRWMQAAGWDRERISHARTPTVDQYPSFLPRLPRLLLTMHFLCLLFRRLASPFHARWENLENGSQRASNLSAHHDKLHGWPRYIYFYRQPLPSILLDIFVLLLSSFLFLDTFNTVPEIVCIFKLMIRVQLFKQKRKMLSRSN